MENGDHEGRDNGEEDIFSGGRGSATAVEEQIPGLNLEKTVESEKEAYPEVSLTGGYSPEAHRDTLDKIKKLREERIKPEGITDYWKKKDKEIAKAMQIEPNSLLSPFYDMLRSVGINLYKRDAKKAVKKLRQAVENIQGKIDKYNLKLDGREKYIPPIQGQPLQEALEQKRRVREKDKGLTYRLNEATDEARMLGYQYRNGERALGDYRQRIASMEEDISSLSKSKEPTAHAKISNIQAQKSVLQREKENLERTQRDYEQQLVTYEKRIDILMAKTSLHECIIRKGTNKLEQVSSGIYILNDYIHERDDIVGVSELLKDLNDLDGEQKKLNDTINQYDKIVEEKVYDLSRMVQSNYLEYSSRPLIQEVNNMNNEDRIATKKDMARILGKLEIPI